MKVTVTFDLDLSDCPAFNMPDIDSIPAAVENLASLFHELHIKQLEKKCRHLGKPNKDDAIQEALLEHTEQDIRLTDQLANTFGVSGTTDDGHDFEFISRDRHGKFVIDGNEEAHWHPN